MFTLEQFEKLQAGEVVSKGKLFPGMTTKEIEFEYTGKDLGGRLLVKASWFGVKLCIYEVWKNTRGKISMLKVK